MLRLANGDIVESTPPIWGIDIKVFSVNNIKLKIGLSQNLIWKFNITKLYFT